ncbi:fumarylacetoacetate hydrolase family protein [Undibacterium sp. TJN25]|uniref:fumarylacetoacetate hydrolase family protein n=1 Tax=Undibacterium sp. TJN25 TaxID=3413056 RepID=UPI003BF0FFFA
MTTRREFLASTGAGAAATAVTAIGVAGDASAKEMHASGKFKGPHEMPRNLTLAAIANKDGSETLAVKTDAGLLDVRAASQLLGIAAPLTMEELLREGNAAGLTKLVAAASAPKAKAAWLDESKITYGRLFTHPGKIVCVGLNYRQHAKEVGMQEPRVPPLFNKYNNSLAAHQCTITLPPKDVAYKFDYETELLIVIGKAARNVSEADALNYVAGYCTSNDFSARDLQLETPSGQWMIGKTLDNFAPIGPYFVSADRVGDPNKLKIETHVNGEVRQSWTTGDFIFNTQQMVSYISKHWTLEPGDIIFTGTPQGVIAGKPKEQQVWLKAGDEITSTIEKLGQLKFRLA